MSVNLNGLTMSYFLVNGMLMLWVADPITTDSEDLYKMLIQRKYTKYVIQNIYYTMYIKGVIYAATTKTCNRLRPCGV